MLPPKQPQMGMQPGSAPVQPAQAGQPPQAGGGTPQQGPQKVDNIGFNQDVQNILISRIDAMSDQVAKPLHDAMMQNLPVFLNFLPEMKIMFAGKTGQGPIGQNQQAPVGGQASPAAGGQLPQGASSAAQPGGQPGQEPDGDEEDETDNPLVRAPASSGLIG